MGKPSSGGSPSNGLFTTNITGPPPGTATTGIELWVDLGLIPSGFRIWFGNARYTSPDKSITFELRTNVLTKSTGTLLNTILLDSGTASVRSGTVTRDLYKSGTLHITSVYGTGVEHFWLRLVSKTSTQGSYLYSINYTTE